MISDVVAGVLVDAIAAVGRQLSANAVVLANRRRGKDLLIARWFDTYRLTADPPVFPDLPAGSADRLATFLRADDVQAVLHELLAARLTDAPEADVERIRDVFDMALSVELPELVRAGRDLFSYYDEQICELTARLEGAEPAVLAQIRAEALSARMIAILAAIERHAASLSSPRSSRDEIAFLKAYRRHVVGHHGLIDPPDFEHRLRVPIAELYVPPVVTQLIDTEPPEKPREIGLWALADEIDRTVLLGDPGCGKTTTANVLMHHYASSPECRVPFLVTLREFAAVDPPERSVAGHIEHKLETFYQCPAPPGLIPRLLVLGAALVVFDGLDELSDTTRRLDLTAIVERFCTEYPLTPVLVTSRAVGYDEARLDDRQFARYRISDFGEEQVSSYVRKWFARQETVDSSGADRSADAFLEESASVPELRANPLMLALMCILYRGEGSLPRDRAEVYARCASLLFQKWDARRRIYLEMRAGHLVEPALRHLAWWLFSHSQAQPAVTERELVQETTAFLTGRGFDSADDARQAAEEFVAFCRGRMWVFTDTGTTATGEALYSFTHRTFLEYFAAARLAYERDTPELLAKALAPHVARHEWEVVGELAVQLKDHTSDRGAQRIYTTLLGERRRRSPAGRGGILQFLARCLRSVSPPPDTVRSLTRTILDHLFDGDPDDPNRALPLGWLLACCDRHRDVVADEIDGRIGQMVDAAHPGDRIKGLRLAAALPFEVTRTNGGPGSSGGGRIGEFWWDHTTELLNTHAAHITAVAADDAGIRWAGLWWRIITLDMALDMPGGVNVLFQHPMLGISGATWAAYLPNAVHWLSRARPRTEPRVSQLIDDLTAFGRYLIASPVPPWIDSPVGDLQFYLPAYDLEEDISGIEIPLSHETTYLGAAATLLIVAESIKSPDILSASRSWPSDSLTGLYPYIQRRWKSNSAVHLDRLPVSDPFKNIFRDWAEHRLSLIDGQAGTAKATSQPD
jgi:hypothetical protein